MAKKPLQIIPHTPGPWHLNHGATVSHRQKASNHPLFKACTPRPFDHTDQSLEMIANATLAAASPKMLATLEAIHQWWTGPQADISGEMPAEIFDAMTTAIAEAKTYR